MLYALGAVQNCCGELECVALMRRAGAFPRLQLLRASGYAMIAQYATGCLSNARKCLMHALAEEGRGGVGDAMGEGGSSSSSILP